ncbi:MAG: hypothetical protein A3G20_01070 [Acidobacteria bacterium RIFCSPLOWO2_12_FULL_59_11]|nr:MAG: hypothetical protein A3G20_01070 [Acidobacteria bacterium RIFCSPLOWO2_12_FULL_59_11]
MEASRAELPEEATMDRQLAAVFVIDKAMFLELIHEMADQRPGHCGIFSIVQWGIVRTQSELFHPTGGGNLAEGARKKIRKTAFIC